MAIEGWVDLVKPNHAYQEPKGNNVASLLSAKKQAQDLRKIAIKYRKEVTGSAGRLHSALRALLDHPIIFETRQDPERGEPGMVFRASFHIASNRVFTLMDSLILPINFQHIVLSHTSKDIPIEKDPNTLYLEFSDPNHIKVYTLNETAPRILTPEETGGVREKLRRVPPFAHAVPGEIKNQPGLASSIASISGCDGRRPLFKQMLYDYLIANLSLQLYTHSVSAFKDKCSKVVFSPYCRFQFMQESDFLNAQATLPLDSYVIIKKADSLSILYITLEGNERLIQEVKPLDKVNQALKPYRVVEDRSLSEAEASELVKLTEKKGKGKKMTGEEDKLLANLQEKQEEWEVLRDAMTAQFGRSLVGEPASIAEGALQKFYGAIGDSIRAHSHLYSEDDADAMHDKAACPAGSISTVLKAFGSDVKMSFAEPFPYELIYPCIETFFLKNVISFSAEQIGLTSDKADLKKALLNYVMTLLIDGAEPTDVEALAAFKEDKALIEQFLAYLGRQSKQDDLKVELNKRINPEKEIINFDKPKNQKLVQDIFRIFTEVIKNPVGQYAIPSGFADELSRICGKSYAQNEAQKTTLIRCQQHFLNLRLMLEFIPALQKKIDFAIREKKYAVTPNLKARAEEKAAHFEKEIRKYLEQMASFNKTLLDIAEDVAESQKKKMFDDYSQQIGVGLAKLGEILQTYAASENNLLTKLDGTKAKLAAIQKSLQEHKTSLETLECDQVVHDFDILDFVEFCWESSEAVGYDANGQVASAFHGLEKVAVIVNDLKSLENSKPLYEKLMHAIRQLKHRADGGNRYLRIVKVFEDYDIPLEESALDLLKIKLASSYENLNEHYIALQTEIEEGSNRYLLGLKAAAPVRPTAPEQPGYAYQNHQNIAGYRHPQTEDQRGGGELSGHRTYREYTPPQFQAPDSEPISTASISDEVRKLREVIKKGDVDELNRHFFMSKPTPEQLNRGYCLHLACLGFVSSVHKDDQELKAKFKQIIDLLIQNGADINHPVSPSGFTPFLILCFSGEWEQLYHHIVYSRPDIIYKRSTAGISPFDIALFSSTATSGSQGPAFSSHAKYNNMLLSLFTYNENSTSLDMFGTKLEGISLLHRFGYFGCDALLNLVLTKLEGMGVQEKKTILNQTIAEGGFTPLMLASLSNHEEEDNAFVSIIEALVLQGADVDQPNHQGETALHLASRMGHTRRVACLLRLGANPELKTTLGLTPLEEAAHHTSVQDIISQGLSVLEQQKQALAKENELFDQINAFNVEDFANKDESVKITELLKLKEALDGCNARTMNSDIKKFNGYVGQLKYHSAMRFMGSLSPEKKERMLAALDSLESSFTASSKSWFLSSSPEDLRYKEYGIREFLTCLKEVKISLQIEAGHPKHNLPIYKEVKRLLALSKPPQVLEEQRNLAARLETHLKTMLNDFLDDPNDEVQKQSTVLEFMIPYIRLIQQWKVTVDYVLIARCYESLLTFVHASLFGRQIALFGAFAFRSFSEAGEGDALNNYKLLMQHLPSQSKIRLIPIMMGLKTKYDDMLLRKQDKWVDIFIPLLQLLEQTYTSEEFPNRLLKRQLEVSELVKEGEFFAVNKKKKVAPEQNPPHEVARVTPPPMVNPAPQVAAVKAQPVQSETPSLSFPSFNQPIAVLNPAFFSIENQRDMVAYLSSLFRKVLAVTQQTHFENHTPVALFHDTRFQKAFLMPILTNVSRQDGKPLLITMHAKNQNNEVESVYFICDQGRLVPLTLFDFMNCILRFGRVQADCTFIAQGPWEFKEVNGSNIFIRLTSLDVTGIQTLNPVYSARFLYNQLQDLNRGGKLMNLNPQTLASSSKTLTLKGQLQLSDGSSFVIESPAIPLHIPERERNQELLIRARYDLNDGDASFRISSSKIQDGLITLDAYSTNDKLKPVNDQFPQGEKWPMYFSLIYSVPVNGKIYYRIGDGSEVNGSRKLYDSLLSLLISNSNVLPYVVTSQGYYPTQEVAMHYDVFAEQHQTVSIGADGQLTIGHHSHRNIRQDALWVNPHQWNRTVNALSAGEPIVTDWTLIAPTKIQSPLEQSIILYFIEQRKRIPAPPQQPASGFSFFPPGAPTPPSQWEDAPWRSNVFTNQFG